MRLCVGIENAGGAVYRRKDTVNQGTKRQLYGRTLLSDSGRCEEA